MLFFSLFTLGSITADILYGSRQSKGLDTRVRNIIWVYIDVSNTSFVKSQSVSWRNCLLSMTLLSLLSSFSWKNQH